MEEINGFYDDEGNKVNFNLIRKPALCVGCKKNNNPNEELLSNMTRFDQRNKPEFVCYAFEAML